MKYIVSFSGGKDSTAMLHLLLENDYPVDGIIFVDTGWEFPGMIEHIDLVEKNIGMEITRLAPKNNFDYMLLRRKVRIRYGEDKGRVTRIGVGWPSMRQRWCTGEKVSAIQRHMKPLGTDATMYIGISADEPTRVKEGRKRGYFNSYPLMEMGLTGEDCLAYCKALGYEWGGLYDKFKRVSCYCCPLQKIAELKKVRLYFPELWKQMLAKDKILTDSDHEGVRGFRGYTTLQRLEIRFAQEDRQQKLPGM